MNHLFSSLNSLPENWLLVPTNGNKQPLGREWQKRPYTPKQLVSELISSGKVLVKGKYGNYHISPQGIGLLCGDYSDHYLVAVDTDGYSASIAIPEPLPHTVSFTSGKPDRAQYLFKLPPGEYRNRKITTAPGEALELRGRGCMSMLPPSKHPTTGEYRWINSPKETECAVAPKWIAELMSVTLPHNIPKSIGSKTIKPFQPQSTYERVSSISVEVARLLLETLPPSLANEYHTWLRVGLALHYISDELKSDWDQWSQSSSKYRPGECDYLWSKFTLSGGITHKTLFWLANNQ